MTRYAIVLAAILAATPLASPAQIYGSRSTGSYGNSGGQQRQALPKTTYDYQSGNLYTTSPTYNGGVRVQGSNMNTGAMWNAEIDRKGNQRGTDSSGNYWTYDQGSKTYMNLGTGKMCTGEGYARICN